MRPILIGLLLLSSCAYPATQVRQQPFAIKVVGHDIQIQEEIGNNCHNKGVFRIANISNQKIYSPKMQAIFWEEGKVLAVAEQTFFGYVYPDEVKEMPYDVKYVRSDKEVHLRVTGWYG